MRGYQVSHHTRPDRTQADGALRGSGPSVPFWPGHGARRNRLYGGLASLMAVAWAAPALAQIPATTAAPATIPETGPESIPETIVVRADRITPLPPAPGTRALSGAGLVEAIPVRLDGVLRVEAPGAGLFRRTGSQVANATIQGLSLRPLAPTGAGRAEVRLDGVPQNDPFGGWVVWGRLDPLFFDGVEVRAGIAGAGDGPLALTGSLDLQETRGSGPARARLSVAEGAMTASGRLPVRVPVAAGGGTLVLAAVHDRADGTVPVDPAQAGAADIPAGHELSSVLAVATVPLDQGAVLSGRMAVFADRRGAGLVGGDSSTRGADASVALRFATERVEGRVIGWAQQRRFANRTVTAGPGRTGTSTANDQYDTPAGAVGLSLLVAPVGAGSPQLSLEWRSAQGETRERFRFLGVGPTRQRVAGGRADVTSLALTVPPRALTGGWELSGAVRADAWRLTQASRIEQDLATGLDVLREAPADRDGIATSGRLIAAHPASGIWLGLGRSVRLPTLNELHRPFRIGNDLTEANAGLAPERLDGVELGWRRPAQGEGLSGSVTLWAARLEGPVTNVTLGAGPGTFPRAGFLPAGSVYRQRLNAGAIEAAGIEAAARWSSAGGLVLSGSVAAGRARVDGGALLPALTGLEPAQSPQVAASLALTVPFGRDRLWQADAVVRAEGRRFEDDLNTRRLDGFVAVDLRLSRRTGAAQWFVAIENAGDARVETALSADGVVSLAGPRQLRVGVIWTGD